MMFLLKLLFHNLIGFQVNNNFAILVRELQPVRKKVNQNLQIAPLIAKHFSEVICLAFKVHKELDVLLHREMVQHCECLVDEAIQVKVAVVDAESAALKLC